MQTTSALPRKLHLFHSTQSFRECWTKPVSSRVSFWTPTRAKCSDLLQRRCKGGGYSRRWLTICVSDTISWMWPCLHTLWIPSASRETGLYSSSFWSL
ncbi:hypothetical protein BCR44DRAFT_1437095 [Catenaria anguillulae PL171]|uniref:Uncharacterized protein n=1 Tax=Catenaria anguillulae PL171 TaxID=765915 RepID=A0A1Y2HHM5_9FUNG|nr:hypothetical protein BCR44DRAFT_1437095 [Catenaria anguillulae PL171]